MSNVAHHCQKVVFRVAEGCYPKIVSTHVRHKRGLFFELNTSLRKGLVGYLNVVDIEIDDRAGVIELGLRGERQHQPDAVAIKESQTRRRREKKLHAQFVAIEVDRAIDIVRVDSDLSDCGKTELI